MCVDVATSDLGGTFGLAQVGLAHVELFGQVDNVVHVEQHNVLHINVTSQEIAVQFQNLLHKLPRPTAGGGHHTDHELFVLVKLHGQMVTAFGS